MGRKAKITAVPIEQQVESIPSGDDEAKTDAQHMTDIINEVNTPVNTSSDEDQKEHDAVEHVEVAPVVQEEAVPKVDTKVACPDCGKQMSAKTLKYSHGPNCSAKKQKQGDEEFANALSGAKQVAQ